MYNPDDDVMTYWCYFKNKIKPETYDLVEKFNHYLAIVVVTKGSTKNQSNYWIKKDCLCLKILLLCNYLSIGIK